MLSMYCDDAASLSELMELYCTELCLLKTWKPIATFLFPNSCLSYLFEIFIVLLYSETSDTRRFGVKCHHQQTKNRQICLEKNGVILK